MRRALRRGPAVGRARSADFRIARVRRDEAREQLDRRRAQEHALRYAPFEQVVVQVEACQRGQVGQLGRYRARQSIAAQVQPLEFLELAQGGRDRPRQGVARAEGAAQLHGDQVREVAYLIDKDGK